MTTCDGCDDIILFRNKVKSDALCKRSVASRRNDSLQGGVRKRIPKPNDCGAERESKIIVIAPLADILLTHARGHAGVTEYT